MYTFTDEQIKAAAEAGLKSAVADWLRTSYSMRDVTNKAMLGAVDHIHGRVTSIMEGHIIAAFSSDAMRTAVAQAIAKDMADKYAGAFKGTIIAAARKAADSPAVRDAVTKAVSEAVLKVAP